MRAKKSRVGSNGKGGAPIAAAGLKPRRAGKPLTRRPELLFGAMATGIKSAIEGARD